MRRAALDDVDGFATSSITEDMLTLIRIHAKGWSSVYHNEGLRLRPCGPRRSIRSISSGNGGGSAAGRCSSRRIRSSCGGSASRNGSAISGASSTRSRDFRSSFSYVTPPIVLFTGVLPMNALDVTYLLHFVPYYVLSLFAFNEMGRGYAGYLMLEQFSMGKFVTYLESFFYLFLPRRARQFKVTPKGRETSTPYPPHCPAGARVRGERHRDRVGDIPASAGLARRRVHHRGEQPLGAFQQRARRGDHSLREIEILSTEREFRIEDAVPVFFSYREGGKPVRRLAASDDATETGMSLIAAGPIPEGGDLELEIMLPRKTLAGKGHVMHVKTVKSGTDVIARAGVAVTGASGEVDMMSRYLHESAVSKFLAGYATRYHVHREPARTETAAQGPGAARPRVSAGRRPREGGRRFVRSDPEHFAERVSPRRARKSRRRGPGGSRSGRRRPERSAPGDRRARHAPTFGGFSPNASRASFSTRPISAW